MKRLFLIILSLFLLGLANAQTWNIGTPNAANVTATLSNDTLYIKGTGNMINYNSVTPAPWYSNRSLIETVVIEEGITNIGSHAFWDCNNLTSITIPESVTSIGSLVFDNCSSLAYITIPARVTSIGSSAFYYCTSLTSITIPPSVTNIGVYAFSVCTSLTSVTIPEGVTSIAESAFASCNSLTSVTIPSSVTSIGNSAFYNCYSLTSVIIPKNVTSIEMSAFWNCIKLTSVTNLNPVPQKISSNTFYGVKLSSDTLIVPCGSLSAYQNASIWQNFGIILEDCLPPIPGVSNVRSTFSCPGEITINYDLYMEDNTKTTNVTVYYSTDNGQTYHLCTTVTGDLLNQSSGKGKSVIWNLRADGFSTGFFVFKVEVPECVWINGVCWAIRNVGEPGKFVNKPEDMGMLYQWNSMVGWSSTDPLISFPNGNSWNSPWNGNGATTWETANNVCPAGFRMPTQVEYQSLVDAGSQWITKNGVNGHEFGSGGNTIFLPAAGNRDYVGSRYGAGEFGNYWSNMRSSSDDGGAHCLYFGDSDWTNVNDSWDISNGLSCRCVKE